METKFTKEYAELLASGLIPKNNKDAYVEGYIDAIKQTASSDILLSLINIIKLIENIPTHNIDSDLLSNIYIEHQKAKQLIKKATE